MLPKGREGASATPGVAQRPTTTHPGTRSQGRERSERPRRGLGLDFGRRGCGRLGGLGRSRALAPIMGCGALAPPLLLYWGAGQAPPL